MQSHGTTEGWASARNGARGVDVQTLGCFDDHLQASTILSAANGATWQGKMTLLEGCQRCAQLKRRCKLGHKLGLNPGHASNYPLSLQFPA